VADHPLLADKPTLAAVQSYISATNKFRGHDESLQTGLLLLCEEVGELAKACRKQNGIRRDSAKANDDHVDEEAADVLWMLCTVCNALGIDLNEAFHAKEQKNKARVWK